MPSPFSNSRSVPSDALIDEFDASMTMLGRMFAARHAGHCGDSQLNMGQSLALRILGELGPKKVGELATMLGVKAPAASSLIDALEKRGLVERAIDPEDRRVHHVTLTDAGRAEVATAEVARREHMRCFLSVLEEEDIKTLIRVQRTLIDVMVADHI